MSINISISLQKGGVGKSTTAQALASIMGVKKKKVLLVDMDSQCNVTFASGFTGKHTMTDIMAEECTIDEAIFNAGTYHLIAADEYLTNLEQMTDVDLYMLKNLLSHVENRYDYIIIDTPPALGNLLKMSLIASDYVIIPTDPRPFALQGIDAFIPTFEELKKENEKLKVLGILLVKFNNRTVLNRQIKQVLDEKAEKLHTKVFDTYIREGIAVAEAQTVGQSLLEYAPKSKPAQDYDNFVKEVLKLIKKERGSSK